MKFETLSWVICVQKPPHEMFDKLEVGTKLIVWTNYSDDTSITKLRTGSIFSGGLDATEYHVKSTDLKYFEPCSSPGYPL